MALSEKWALEKARGLMWNPKYTGFDPVAFTRAIEAEVRKQDDALIRQLADALEYHRAQTRPIELTDEAITAGRAWLEGKP